jgi:hypothetical protein
MTTRRTGATLAWITVIVVVGFTLVIAVARLTGTDNAQAEEGRDTCADGVRGHDVLLHVLGDLTYIA